VTDDATYTLSADVFQFWAIDRVAKQIRLVLQDGRKFEEPIDDNDPILNSEIAMSLFDWEKWWVTSITKRGHVIFAEGYSPNTENPLGRLPAVYLDQNHWSTVALAMVDPGKVKSETELAAAYELVRLGSDAGIVLPLSSGHMLETGGLVGDKRYDLAVAMASLSGGWQLRHPVNVWRQEAAQVLADVIRVPRPEKALRVICLDPNAALSSGKRPEDFDPDSAELFLLMLTCSSVLVDLLLDPERTERGDLSKWLAHQRKVTAELAAITGPKEAKRKMALRRFWEGDLQAFHNGYADLRADRPFPELTDQQLAKHLTTMPMVGYLSGLFTQRYVSATTVWKRNDLLDMMFLSCAAGYADFVAAEAHTGTQLAQLQRARGGPQTVFTTLHDLVEALLASGAQTATERDEH